MQYLAPSTFNIWWQTSDREEGFQNEVLSDLGGRIFLQMKYLHS